VESGQHSVITFLVWLAMAAEGGATLRSPDDAKRMMDEVRTALRGISERVEKERQLVGDVAANSGCASSASMQHQSHQLRKRARSPLTRHRGSNGSDSDEVTIITTANTDLLITRADATGPAALMAAAAKRCRGNGTSGMGAAVPMIVPDGEDGVEATVNATCAQDQLRFDDPSPDRRETGDQKEKIFPSKNNTSGQKSFRFDEPPEGWRETIMSGSGLQGGREVVKQATKPVLDHAAATQPMWKRHEALGARAAALEALAEQKREERIAMQKEAAEKKVHSITTEKLSGHRLATKELDAGVTLAAAASEWTAVDARTRIHGGVYQSLAERKASEQSSPIVEDGINNDVASAALCQAAAFLDDKQTMGPCQKERLQSEEVRSSPASPERAVGSTNTIDNGNATSNRHEELQQVELDQEQLEEEWRPGCKVELKDLKNAGYLNGQCGVLETFVLDTGRWRVKLNGGESKDLKTENLALDELQPGCEVRLHGLKNSAYLNGECGVLATFNQGCGRWRVSLNDGQCKDIKPENIVKNKLQQYMLKAKQKHEKHEESQKESEERRNEYFEAAPGSSWGPGSRFIIQEKLGEGVFATVFRCRDAEVHGAEYAVKFARANPIMRKAMEREIKVMGKLCAYASKHDPEGARHLLSLAFYEGFVCQGHLAAAFELMKCNLCVALERYGHGRGLPLLPTVRNFGRNVFVALRVLRGAGLIHCDVKPENLLLSMDNESIKLCDFGSVMGVNEWICTNYIQPRFYRAPEVMLGQPYSTGIDTWSAGSTLFQLATDHVLFQGETNNDMLHAILKVCGPFPQVFATSGRSASTHFNDSGDFLIARGDVAVHGTGPRTIPMANFSQPSQPVAVLLEERLREPPRGVTRVRHEGLVHHLTDLLLRCLVVDPADRATPELALAHRFFQKGA